MKPLLAGIAAIVIALAALSPRQATASSPELKITKASISGTSVTVYVKNVTKGSKVSGRFITYFNDGDATQSLTFNVSLEPGGVEKITAAFDPGKVSPNGVRDEPVPIGYILGPGIIIVGTITDDITPF